MYLSSLVSACITILIAVIFLCSCAEQSAEEKQFSQDLVQQNTALQQEVNQLKLRLDSLEQHSATYTSANTNTPLSEADLSYLKNRGLQDPVNQIKANLLENNRLIPAKGTLGGTMRFYKERIYVLNRKWVFAYFEDGHMAGQMLLEYQVDNNGKISWRVLTTTMM